MLCSKGRAGSSPASGTTRGFDAKGTSVAEGEVGSVIPAGWYADYTGEQRMRWWDGSQWTEHVSATGPTLHSGTPARNTVPASTPVGNVFIWVIVLLPIIPLMLTFGIDFRGIMQQAIDNPANPLAIYSSPGYLALVLSGWVILAVTVVLAWFDERRLLASGFDRPFPWGWAFLSYVYIIGRAVVVRRRSGRGLAPLFVWIGIYAVSFIVSIGQVATAISFISQNPSGGFTNT